MHPLGQDPKKLLPLFDTMDSALIDASSMIYLTKTGCFDSLRKTLRLHTLPEIMDETGMRFDEVIRVDTPHPHLSNDEKLIACAGEMGLPVITEDRKIVLHMAGRDHPVFNALIMLSFLVHRKAIDRADHPRLLASLRKVAWYSPKVWEFGGRVYEEVIARMETD